LDHQPVVSVDLIGVEPITPILQGSVASIGMQAHFIKRSVRELNPVFRLTTAACGRNTYRPFRVSDPGWNRTSTLLHVTQASSPLDHGTVVFLLVTEVGVEPTKSPRSQRDRFASLRTRSWRVRVSHPAVGTYEAPLGAGPPASCRSRYRTGLTGLMKASWAPAAPAMYFSSQGEDRTRMSYGHDVLNVARIPNFATWPYSAARTGVEPVSRE
jgi:hypothetical protein